MLERIDAAETNNAALVAYALSLALFNELSTTAKERVKQSALTYLPPKPDGTMPADLAIWRRAHKELKTLA